MAHTKYTNEQMDQAFDNVKDPANWKNPIDATIDNPGEKNLDCLSEAITFYTGSLAMITDLPGNKVRVQADGYYISIGA